jgi:hypothetical protein
LAKEARVWAASHERDAPQGRGGRKSSGHPIIILVVDVGALGEELVDEAELAVKRREVERGKAVLRSRRGKAAVFRRGVVAAAGAEHRISICVRQVHSHATW